MKFLLALTACIFISGAAKAETDDVFSVIGNRQYNALTQLDVNTARAIYSGRTTSWDNVPGSGLRGYIFALALDPSEPESQAFLSRVGLTQFGDNVIVVSLPEAREIIAIAVALVGEAIGIDDPAAVLPEDKVLPLVKNFSVIVNRASNGLTETDVTTARNIFSGTTTTWDAVPGSVLTGAILALRLGNTVPATQAFQSYVGLTQFGSNVNILTGPSAPLILAVNVESNSKAIGVETPSAVRAGNRDLWINP
jgi:ABC-type phosphate transport system substrate-binding protein